ncbi:MAG TPA: PEP-CTERM sorting domain-containing protein [Bryobacteraceae bacterium]|nr:PEP-CTERM sorting domain-containing protein [Bryobacteraceae bacterium]HUO32902.1 PEP-CTERM sorting domain-containing protein [Bryobacteraceae bacterium]
MTPSLQHTSLKFSTFLVATLIMAALSPSSKADTTFSISGPTVSGEVTTSASLSTIEGIGTGTYDIFGSLTSLSLSGDGYDLTLGNLFQFGNSTTDFELYVTGGVITGWQFVGFTDNGLTYNSMDGGYDGTTQGIGTSFGGSDSWGDPNTDIIDVGTGCTALGTATGACTSVSVGGSGTTTLQDMTIAETPEPATLPVLGAGLLAVAIATRRRAQRKLQ